MFLTRTIVDHILGPYTSAERPPVMEVDDFQVTLTQDTVLVTVEVQWPVSTGPYNPRGLRTGGNHERWTYHVTYEGGPLKHAVKIVFSARFIDAMRRP